MSTRPVAQTSSNSPPRPTDCSCRGSPTRTSRQRVGFGEFDEVVQRRGGQHPGFVDDERCAGRRAGRPGRAGRSSRRHSWSSLATVSVGIRVSASRTRAALAVGATPNAGRPWRSRSSTAAASIRVLPAPAGPTTTVSRSWPATDAAAAACIGSRPPLRTVADGDGASTWARAAQERTASSWTRMLSVVKCAAVGSMRTDRPSEARRDTGVSGSRSIKSAVIRSVACSSHAAQSTPDTVDAGRWRSQSARSTSARPHADRVSDSSSRTSLTMIGRGDVRRRPASAIVSVNCSAVQPTPAASLCHRVVRSGTPWPDLWARVSADASRVSAARSQRDGSRPSRWRNSSSLASRATSIAAERLENTSSSSAGMPAISAWPLTIGPKATPRRCDSSARSTDWYRPPMMRWWRFR